MDPSTNLLQKVCLHTLESGNEDELSTQRSDTDTQCVKLKQGELIDCGGKNRPSSRQDGTLVDAYLQRTTVW